MLGIELPDAPEDDEGFEVWPCNWDALVWMLRVATQWRVGPAGMTGLDYTSVIETMREFGVRRVRRAEILSDIMVMESTILGLMAERST